MTSSGAFQALFQRSKRIDRPSMIVRWQETVEPRRVGFAVSRQIRGAVLRNRGRRRLREAYRVARHAGPARVDMVIIARPGALRVSFGALVDEMRTAFALIPGARA